MQHTQTTYIIFGASGDLSKRYLLPALENIKSIDNIVHISRKDYGNLRNLIPTEGNKIFHLAIPPEGVSEAIEVISSNFGREDVKIMLEKPFGKDLESAQSLVAHIEKYFSEDQIYRVDHYLAKHTLQNVVTAEWERNNIESIDIVASEKIDIEGRVKFYEQTGALKDFVQSHLLEMAALVLSKSFESKLRYEALRNLEVVCDITKSECVKRGQYEGYKEEVGNNASTVETFVSINLATNDPHFRGTSIRVSTGKALREKLTEVRIKYKSGVVKIFNIEQEPETYGRVIEAAISGNQELFISRDEVLETWRILEAIQNTWKAGGEDLIIYKKGSGIEEV